MVTAEDGRAALVMLLTGEAPSPTTPARSQYSPSPGESPGEKSTVMQYEHQFHIVFLDNQMPHLSGVEMTKNLRAYGRKYVFFAITRQVR